MNRKYDDGHLLLLFEFGEGRKTFKEFSRRVNCMDGIREMYERFMDPEGRQLEQPTYKLEDIYNYLDSFKNVVLLEYQADISRYKEYNREQLKELMLSEIQKLE